MIDDITFTGAILILISAVIIFIHFVGSFALWMFLTICARELNSIVQEPGPNFPTSKEVKTMFQKTHLIVLCDRIRPITFPR